MKGCSRIFLSDMTMIEEKLHSLSPPLYSLSLREDKDILDSDYMEVENTSSDTNGYLNGNSSDDGGRESSGCKSPDSDIDVETLGKMDDVDGLRSRGMSDKKTYHCTHCKYVTDRKNNLKRHVVTMHETCTKVLECCDAMFQNKASLRDHVLSCHKNGYECRICGRNFCRKALLKRHITVHSGQKDYICNVCGYATSHKSNLDRHKRRHGPKFLGGDDHHSLESLSPTPTMDMGKVLPMDYPCSPLPGSLHYPYQTEITEVKPYYPNHKHKLKYGRYIFTKRLLCTYDKNSPKIEEKSQLEDDVNSNNLHKSHDIENVQKEPKQCVQRNNNHNILLPPKKSHSTRRLFPTLYRCKECGVVLDNQLELTEHLAGSHVTDEESPTQAPQRPLTLQAKHRGWY